MHLETIKHLRQVATQHDDTVPVAKSLLLDLLDSYEQHATQPVNKVTPVNPVPTPETFEAHGHTWTRHTPGDLCPIAPDALVFVLWLSDMVTDCSDVIAVACDFDWSTRPAPDEQIIGWRHAAPQPSTPDK